MAKIDKVQEVAVERLVPYANNAKKHGKDQIQRLKASIEEFGFLTPCLIDKEYNLIAGHGRVQAAMEMGMESVPCVFIEGLTEAQRKAYILADNRLGELGEWDMDLVMEELTSLNDMDFDVSITGFDFDSLIATADEVVDDEYEPVVPKEPTSKKGEIYQLGRHRVMCGDATDPSMVKALVGDVKVDLFLTDPPYNVALGMGGSYDTARKIHRRTDGLVIMNDSMDDAEYRDFLTKAFLCAKQNMKDGASFYIWHADNEGYTVRGAVMDAGFKSRQTLIWEKNAITLGRQDYQWKHEPCLYGWNDGAGHSWYSDRTQSTVLYFDKPSRSVEHPTMKPVPLFDYLIKNSTKSGDIVLDTFGGSGTTIIACEQNGRSGYLMELDPRYVDVIINRWETLTREKAKLISTYGAEGE